MSASKRHVLFLTTGDPKRMMSSRGNEMPNESLQRAGARTEARAWYDANLTMSTLAHFDTISLLLCDKYNYYLSDFARFLKAVLIPLQEQHPHIHVFNDPEIILWNMDKIYLAELQDAGFSMPKTRFMDLSQHDLQTLESVVQGLPAARPVILKPSVGASGRLCHRINAPQSLTREDRECLQDFLDAQDIGSLMIQDFEMGIARGEYSLLYIHGTFTHAVLKVPAQGEYRINSAFGGRYEEVLWSDVPLPARETGQRLVDFLTSKFAKGDANAMKRRMEYLRVDGVMREDGSFALIEAELIEPFLFLQFNKDMKGITAYCQAYME